MCQSKHSSHHHHADYTHQTFVETSNGYKVTAPEGYVAISGGQAVKLIDRIEFANLNFNVPKKW